VGSIACRANRPRFGCCSGFATSAPVRVRFTGEAEKRDFSSVLDEIDGIGSRRRSGARSVRIGSVLRAPIATTSRA
jgi:hypothetical protein